MEWVHHIIEWMRKVLDSEFAVVWEFASIVVGIFLQFRVVIKRAEVRVHTIKGILLLLAILLFGLVFPILIILFSNWSGMWQIAINLGAAYLLFSFFGLIYVIIKMKPFIATANPSPASEEALIQLRTTHTFFEGHVHIYLADVDFYGRPLGHKVTARIWSLQTDEVIIKRKLIGFSVVYGSGPIFRVRITRAGINEATFQVTLLSHEAHRM